MTVNVTQLLHHPIHTVLMLTLSNGSASQRRRRLYDDAMPSRIAPDHAMFVVM